MNRRNFLGTMCGAAIMPPKELLKAFEPKPVSVLMEWVQCSPVYILKLTNVMDTPAFIEIIMSKDRKTVREVTLTVNGEKSIIKSEWGVFPTT
jgi:hypothetical protein